MKAIILFALLAVGTFAGTTTDPLTGRVWTWAADTTSKKCTLVSDATSPTTLSFGSDGTNQCTPTQATIDGTVMWIAGTATDKIAADKNSGFSNTAVGPGGLGAFVAKFDISTATTPALVKWSYYAVRKAADDTIVQIASVEGIWKCSTAKIAFTFTAVTASSDKLLSAGATLAALGTGTATTVNADKKGLYIINDDTLAILENSATVATNQAQCGADVSTVADAATTPVTWTLGHYQVSDTQTVCYIKKATTTTELANTSGKKCIAIKILADGNNLYAVLNNDATFSTTPVPAIAFTGNPFPSTTVNTAVLLKFDASATTLAASKASYYQAQTAATTPALTGFHATAAEWCLGNIRIAGRTTTVAGTDKLPGAAATATTFVAGPAAITGNIAVDKTSFAVLAATASTALPATCSADIKKVTDTTVTPNVDWTVGHTQTDSLTIRCWVKRGTTEVSIESTSNKKCNAVGLVLEKSVPYAAFNTNAGLDTAGLVSSTVLAGAAFETIPVAITTDQTAVIVKLDAATGKVADGTYLAGKSATAFVASPATAFDNCSTAALKVTVSVGAGNFAPAKSATATGTWVNGPSSAALLAVDKTALTITESVASTGSLAACSTTSDDVAVDDEESAGVLAIANLALAFLGLAYMF
jgi:hypothetical protein